MTAAPVSTLKVISLSSMHSHSYHPSCRILGSYGIVLPHMRILAHTCMGRPICVYSYGAPIRVWDSILSHMSILFACFISLQVFGYCCYKQI